MRAALLVALWVTVSIPLAFAVGAVLRGMRASELAEEVDAYLRRLAHGRGAAARRTTRIVFVCAGAVVLAAGSLRLVADVPHRVLTAGIRNADLFGRGPGGDGPARTARIERGSEDVVAAAPTARPRTDLVDSPLTADDLGIPVPGAMPAAASRPAGSTPTTTATPSGEQDDAPPRQPAAVAGTGEPEPVSEPAEASEPAEEDDRDPSRDSTSAGAAATTTTTAPTTTTTAPTTTTTAPTTTTTSPTTTTTSTTTTSTTTTSTTTTSTTTTSTTTTTAPPETTTTTTSTTTTSTTAPPADSDGNGNGMGPIEHEPAAVGDDAAPAPTAFLLTATDEPAATEPESTAVPEPTADATGDA